VSVLDEILEGVRADLASRQEHAPLERLKEAAAKARYLIQLYAATPDARDPRRQKLIAGVLADLARLSE